MKSIKEMNQAELAAYVQNHLKGHGIIAVLSGGAAVGIYCNYQYISNDIDLVNAQFAERNRIVSAMKEIGFNQVGRHFEHQDTDHIIEFPPGPLTVGRDKVAELNEISLETGNLSVITPTDCVKDRLSHYFHWGDRQCLTQAKLVSETQKIDLEEISAWSVREGKIKEFEKIMDELQ